MKLLDCFLSVFKRKKIGVHPLLYNQIVFTNHNKLINYICTMPENIRIKPKTRGLLIPYERVQTSSVGLTFYETFHDKEGDIVYFSAS